MSDNLPADPLELALRGQALPIADDGFTRGVLASLPPRRVGQRALAPERMSWVSIGGCLLAILLPLASEPWQSDLGGATAVALAAAALVSAAVWAAARSLARPTWLRLPPRALGRWLSWPATGLRALVRL